MLTYLSSKGQFLKWLLIGFFLVLVLFELLSIVSDSPNGQWEIRRQKEQTTVIMHAEDVWRNKRSTLQSFDPLSCINQFHSQWRSSWHEVTCIAKDDKDQNWQYVARYGKRSSYLIGLIPFINDSRPEREFLKLEKATSVSGDAR
jgi:hypothetical protein